MMKRYLLRTIVVASVLLSAASGFMWIRSHHQGDRVLVGGGSIGVVQSVRGMVSFRRSTIIHEQSIFDWRVFERPEENEELCCGEGLWEHAEDPWYFLIAGWSDVHQLEWLQYPGVTLVVAYDTNGRFQWRYSQLIVDWWCLVLVSSIPFSFLVCSRLARYVRRSRRSRHGECLHCGFDLRGSPSRCSECGTPSKEWKSLVGVNNQES